MPDAAFVFPSPSLRKNFLIFTTLQSIRSTIMLLIIKTVQKSETNFIHLYNGAFPLQNCDQKTNSQDLKPPEKKPSMPSGLPVQIAQTKMQSEKDIMFYSRLKDTSSIPRRTKVADNKIRDKWKQTEKTCPNARRKNDFKTLPTCAMWKEAFRMTDLAGHTTSLITFQYTFLAEFRPLCVSDLFPRNRLRNSE